MKRKRQITNINSELTSSVIEVIFSKLPFFNLPSCRIVCKEWNELIITTRKFDSRISISNLLFQHVRDNLFCAEFDPNHAKQMSIVASFNFDPKLSDGLRSMSIVNSCNGLLCLLIRKLSTKGFTPCEVVHSPVFILNPMTNEYFKLQISKSNRTVQYRYCLGFSPKTKQYKLARASRIFDRFSTRIEIYAFGTSSEWRTVGLIQSKPLSNGFVYSNGGIYLFRDGRNPVIYRLDIEDESIREISSPRYKGTFHRMIDVDGTFYLTFNVKRYGYHVWRLMEDFSWIKVFVFSEGSKFFSFKFFKVYENGKILCKYKLDFILYDSMSDSKEILDYQFAKMKGMKSFHRIGSSNFNSLPNILAGNN